MAMVTSTLPVVVIGAGPIGLAAAANLHEQGLPFVVFEAGDDVGGNIRQWGHVRLFSPWRYNVDPAGARLLRAAGWDDPDPDAHPTGRELVDRYLRPLGDLADIGGSLSTNRRVVSVTRPGVHGMAGRYRASQPFAVVTESDRGVEWTPARAVIDASGTWLTPNPLGADGCPAGGESTVRDQITHGVPDALAADRRRFAGRRIVVVGSGHSAQNVVRDRAALAADSPGTEVTWVIRRPDADRILGGGQDDQLPERARLGAEARQLVQRGQVRLVAGFRIEELVPCEESVLLRSGDEELGPFDQIVSATGFRPDLSFLRDLTLDLDTVIESPRALAPLIDPAVHDCGSVPPHGVVELTHPEPDLYLVGAKSYGRAPTFLLSTGYEQVRSVVAELAGDHAAARDVQLAFGSNAACSVGPEEPAACGPASAACGPASAGTTAGRSDGLPVGCRC